MKVKNIPTGAILWKKEKILGVKGITLSNKYNNKKCIKVEGNDFDYELITFKDFKKMAKEEFDCDVTKTNKEEHDTFESLFGDMFKF